MTDLQAIAGRYVFLASNAYSGSTLLSFLIGAHPSIGTVSDVSGARREDSMTTFTCSCGLRMADCPFWQQLDERLTTTGMAFSLSNFRLGFDDHHPRWMGRLRARSLRHGWIEEVRDRAFTLVPGNEARMREIGRRNAAFALAMMSVSGADVFVDASKERLRARFLQRYVDPDLRVIHLVRDVRGVVESTVRRNKRHLSPVAAAHRWAQTNRAIMRSMAKLSPDRRMLVRYEDLCRDPDATMRRIYEFCGVDPSAAPAELEGSAQHLIGNRMRLERIGDLKIDNRWETALSPHDLRGIVTAADPTFRALYPDPPAAAFETAPTIHG